MIVRIRHTDLLSGGFSPLLPCLETADCFGGGLFEQMDETGRTALLGLVGTTAYLSADKTPPLAEIVSFCRLSGVDLILAEIPLPRSRALPLMTATSVGGCTEDVRFLTPGSSQSEYRAAAELLFQREAERESFYLALSQRIVAESAACALFVENGAVIGAAAAPYFCSVGASISGVAVSPEARGRGVGTACVTALVSHLRQYGKNTVTLWCERETVPFYKNAGFTERGCVYEGIVDDLL